MNTEKISYHEMLKISFRALRTSFKTMGPLSLIISITGFAIAFLPVFISDILARFTNEVQALSQGNAFVVNAILLLSILILLYLIQTIYASLQSYYSAFNAQRMAKFIKSEIIKCSCNVEYKYIENENDFRNRLLFAEMEGGVRVAQSMQQILFIIQYFITFLSIIIKLSVVSNWINFILLVGCIPGVVLTKLQKNEEYKLKTEEMKDGAMSVHLYYICAGANERCRSLLDMRFGEIFPWTKQKWRVISDRFIKKKNMMTARHVFYNSLSDIFRYFVYTTVIVIVVWHIYNSSDFKLGIFMLVFSLSAQFQNTTTKMFSGITRFLGDIRYIKDFFDICDTPVEYMEKEPVKLESADIIFKNVSFIYPNTTKKVISNLNIRINQGEKVAIVGENGSGKSTFINLLCGIYKPNKGNIYIGGVNLSDNLSTVRRAISVVFQNFGRYETSIRENITIANGTKVESEEKLTQCAIMTGAYDFIKKQPKGFDEEVGTFSETGNNLSGGQWQKIALTRAMYRDEACIIVLDEPTAALDPISEAAIYRDFTELTQDKTTILISHRLGITNIVDRILVFKDGSIIEDGSHDELIKLKGQYAKMYAAQAKWYK